LIVYKARAELRAQVSQSFMGVLWWIVEPLLFLGAFSIVFTQIIDRGDEDFVPFLLTGLVPWKWFASSLSSGCNSIASNGGLMRLVYLPKHIYPAVSVVNATIKFGFVFCLLLVAVLGFGKPITAAWALLPVIIGLQFVLQLGVAMLAASLIPFARDLRLLVDNLLLLLMFLSGVFYPISTFDAEYGWLFLMNPVADLLSCYRAVLLDGTAPNLLAMAVIAAYAVFFCTVGHLTLKRFDRVYPKIVA